MGQDTRDERTAQAPSYRDKLREDVLAVALALVEAEGLSALQARRLARECGCAVGSLYNVFGDIDDLIAAVNSHTLRRLGQAVLEALEACEGREIGDRLLALALGYVRFALANQPAWKAIFEHRRVPGSPAPQFYVDEQMRLIGVIEHVLAMRGGDPIERGQQARALFAAVHGIVALALDDRLGGATRKELEAQVRFIVDVIARGLPAAG